MGTLHDNQYTFLVISRLIIFRMKNFIFEYFAKICLEILSFITIGQE
jgi:hypothetical protein